MIDKTLLAKHTNAFVLFEIANHSVDPRNQLAGTTMRNTKDEGFKYDTISDWESAVLEEGSFSEKVINAINHTNLVDYHQKDKLVEKMTGTDGTKVEEALTLLYRGNDDEKAFNDLVKLIGGRFDVLGFFFFLKDPSKYMPVRSSIFDGIFALLGIDSGLSGNCSWEKYQQYNGWVKEVCDSLQQNLNPDVTLIDAHSFLWVLPGLASYLENENQAVEHSKFGKGVVLGFENDLIVVRFGKEIKKFGKEAAFDKGLLRMIPTNVNIYGRPVALRPADDETKHINADEDYKLIQDLREPVLPEEKEKPVYKGGVEEAPANVKGKERSVPPRDRKIAWNALVMANYQCEIDSSHETFVRRNANIPYTEPHHLVPMAYQEQLGINLDREENIVSLCSNCHNWIHYGKGAETLIEKLYLKRCDLLKSIGVELPLEEVLKLYE